MGVTRELQFNKHLQSRSSPRCRHLKFAVGWAFWGKCPPLKNIWKWRTTAVQILRESRKSMIDENPPIFSKSEVTSKRSKQRNFSDWARVPESAHKDGIFLSIRLCSFLALGMWVFAEWCTSVSACLVSASCLKQTSAGTASACLVMCSGILWSLFLKFCHCSESILRIISLD